MSKDVILTPEQIAAEERRWLFDAPIAELAEVKGVTVDEAVKLRTDAILQEAAVPIEVTVRPIEPQGKLIGFASVNYGGVVIDDFKVVDGKNGIFLGAPSKPDPTSRTGYRSTVRINDRATQERLNAAGAQAYHSAVEKLIASGAPHGELRIVFTTDEEVGRGTEGLDVKELACDWGYTVDGGELGVYEYENFNAAAALVRVHGVGIHPGSAKNIMKNAATIAMELHSLLPADQVPEKTEGYEGFIHLTDMSGDVVEAELHYIIRDHDRTLFEEKKACLRAAVEEINRRYGEGTAEADISDTYYNMREKIEPHRHLLDRAEAAYRACGVAPRTEAIRGGTDGAVLTWMGLPCPNLSTGGYNYHGVHEFIPVDSLAVMPDVLLEIIGSFVENV